MAILRSSCGLARLFGAFLVAVNTVTALSRKPPILFSLRSLNRIILALLALVCAGVMAYPGATAIHQTSLCLLVHLASALTLAMNVVRQRNCLRNYPGRSIGVADSIIAPADILAETSISSAIWFLAPVAKLAYLALLAGNSMAFYNSYVFSGEWNPGGSTIVAVISRLAGVYRHTFLESWPALIDPLSQSQWFGVSIVCVLLIGAIAWRLTRHAAYQDLPSTPALSLSVAGGILLIIPSVGVLIWLEQYSGDLWRTYFYVPIGAAIALVSLIALVSTPITRVALRHAVIIALSLAVCFSGLLRLYQQHERLVASADNKAILLHNLLKVAPRIHPDTIMLLMTELTRDELDATDFYEFQYSHELDDSILYVLYGDRVPVTSYFCLASEPCPLWENETDSDSADSPAAILQRTLVLKINDDLTVELIEDPATFLRLGYQRPLRRQPALRRRRVPAVPRRNHARSRSAPLKALAWSDAAHCLTML